MRKLIAFEFLSLDGFMAGPDGHEMDFVMAGFDNDMEQDLATQYAALDALVMGKTTFQNLAGYWPTPAASGEYLQTVMNAMQKLVFSTTLAEMQWNNSRRLAGDPVSALRSMKQTDGKDIMIIGSASVVQALVQSRLIDEFRFYIFPAVLGMGKPLFAPDAAPGPLKLLQTKRFATGVIRTDYVRG